MGVNAAGAYLFSSKKSRSSCSQELMAYCVWLIEGFAIPKRSVLLSTDGLSLVYVQPR
jgi:hypothetical protein